MKRVKLTDRGELVAKDVLLQIVRSPLGGVGRAGTTIDEMRADIRLLDAVEPALAHVDLEDADWERLCSKVKAFPFAFSDRLLVELCDDILQAAPPQAQ